MADLTGLDANSEKAKSLSKFMGSFSTLRYILQESDWPPTIQMINAVKENELAFKQFYKTGK